MTPPPADVVYSAHMVARRRAVRAARRARIRRVVAAVLATGGLAYGGWALVHSSLFSVDGIRVAGISHVSQTELLATSGVKIGMNVLSVDTSAVARRIETLPYVAHASVERIYPSKLRIVVREREPVAIADLPSGKWIIDGLGVALEPVAEYAGLPVVRSAGTAEVRLGSAIADPGLVEGLKIWRGLPGSMRTTLRTLEAGSPAAVTLKLGTWSVVVGSASDLHTKLRVLNLLLARAHAEGKRISRVDLRAPTHPAVRFA